MKKLMLSPVEIALQFTQAKTLGELMRATEDDLQKKGEVICRFSVNDLLFSENDEKQFSEMPVSEIQKFEIEHESTSHIFNEVLTSWVDSLDKMVVSCDELSKKIRFDGQEGHLGDLVKMIDSCHFLVESLVSMRSLNKENIDKLLKKWNENEILLLKSVEETLNAFEKKDFVLMADVLEYDLAHSLHCWKELLAELLQSINSGVVVERSHHLADRSS